MKKFLPMIISVVVILFVAPLFESLLGLGLVILALLVFHANIIYFIIKYLFFMSAEEADEYRAVIGKNKIFEKIYAAIISIITIVGVINIFYYMNPVKLSHIIVFFIYYWYYLLALLLGFVVLAVVTLPALFIKNKISFKRILRIEFISLCSTLISCFVLLQLPYTRNMMSDYPRNENIIEFISICMKVNRYEKDYKKIERVKYDETDNITFLAYKEYDDNPDLIILDNNDVQLFSYEEVLEKVQSQLDPEQKISYRFNIYEHGYSIYESPSAYSSEYERDRFAAYLKYSDKSLSVSLYQTNSKDDTIKHFFDVESDTNLIQANSLAKEFVDAVVVNNKNIIDKITTDDFYFDSSINNKLNNELLYSYVFFNPRPKESTYGSYMNNVRVKIRKTDPNQPDISRLTDYYNISFYYKIIDNKMLISSAQINAVNIQP